MDKSIPQAAATLLDFIAKPEVGRTDRSGYDVISSFKQGKLAKPLTSMTVADVLREQQTWRRRYGTLSSAAGRYQIIHKTLLMLVKVLGLSGKERFSPDLQDRMGYQLLRYRGYDAFMSGEITSMEYGMRLAKEWASLPVLRNTKNYKGQNIKRGSSYYAGDGLNSHGVSAASFERALQVHQNGFENQPAPPNLKEPVASLDLEQALEAASCQTAETNPPKPDSTATAAGKLGGAAAAGGAVIVAAPEAVNTVNDLTPVFNSLSDLSVYGPYVIGAIVVVVVGLIIWKKMRKG